MILLSEFLPLGSGLRALGQISVLAFKLQSARGVFDTAPGQQCHTGCPELHNILALSPARTQPATPLLQGLRAQREEEKCNLEGRSFAWCIRKNPYIAKKPEGINLVHKWGLPLVPGISNIKEIAEELEPSEAKKDPDFFVYVC